MRQGTHINARGEEADGIQVKASLRTQKKVGKRELPLNYPCIFAESSKQSLFHWSDTSYQGGKSIVTQLRITNNFSI